MELTQRDLIDLAIYNYNKDELYHHGILGMKWGVRKYQNEDGSLTPEGKRRYRETSYGERLGLTNLQSNMRSAQMAFGLSGAIAAANANKQTTERLKGLSNRDAKKEEEKLKADAKKGRQICSGILSGSMAGYMGMAAGAALTAMNPVIGIGAGVATGILGGIGGAALSGSLFDKQWDKSMENNRYVARSKDEIEEYDRKHKR